MMWHEAFWGTTIIQSVCYMFALWTHRHTHSHAFSCFTIEGWGDKTFKCSLAAIEEMGSKKTGLFRQCGKPNVDCGWVEMSMLS